jgi:hypothetical protein
MLQLALRVCVEQETKPPQPATTPAPAAAADDSSALQDAAPLPLRLSCLSADVAITSPAALRLLAALGLQGLKLLLQPAQVTAALCSALSRMHSVRHVELTLPEGKELPVQLAAALGQLTQLTHLHVRSGVGQEAGKVLPAALEHLQLDMDKVHPSDALDLSHLTSLSAAVIVNETDDVMQLVLPAQSGVELSLELDGRVDMQAGSGVACLTVSYYNLEDWQALHFLSAQPHLRALCLYNYDRPYPVEEADVSGCAGIAAELGSLTGLTRLKLFQLPLGLGQLPRLRQLVSLWWDSSWEQPLADVLHLSALTQLTGFVFIGKGLIDVAAVILAGALTQLQRLCLRTCSITTWSMLPLVGRLTSLRVLDLCPSDEARLDSLLLQQLSCVTGLTRLSLPVQHCSQESQQQLLARLPGLKAIEKGRFLWRDD